MTEKELDTTPRDRQVSSGTVTVCQLPLEFCGTELHLRCALEFDGDMIVLKVSVKGISEMALPRDPQFNGMLQGISWRTGQ